MTKRRWIILCSALGVVLVIAAILTLMHWLQPIWAYGVTGPLETTTEVALKKELAPALEALDNAGIRYSLAFNDFHEWPDEASLGIVVPLKDVDKMQDTISMALYGIPDAKIEHGRFLRND